MMVITQPLNGCELTKNRLQTTFEPLLELTDAKKDYVKMMFLEKLCFQCFRTAALFMVTPNMESQNPVGRVYAENHSKTKILRCQWVNFDYISNRESSVITKKNLMLIIILGVYGLLKCS